MQAPRNAKLLSFAFALDVQPYIKKHELVCFLNSVLAPWIPLPQLLPRVFLKTHLWGRRCQV